MCWQRSPSAAHHDGHAATTPSQQPNKKDETAERFRNQPILLLVFEHFQSVFTVETVTNWKARELQLLGSTGNYVHKKSTEAL